MLRINGWSARAALVTALLVAAAPGAGAQEAAPVAPAAPAAPLADGKAVFTSDHVVRAGETVDDIVVVGGDLRVQGTVTGDAVVVGGELILDESGMIEGDATVTGGGIVDNGGRIRGEMRTLDGDGGAGDVGAAVGVATAEQIREEARQAVREAREEGRDAERWDGDRERGGWFGSIMNGFVGLISTIAFGLLLAVAGAVLIFYGRPYLDTVSDTIRASTVRSGAVGLAASFLVIPAFVVLVVALAVSIIGIPFLLLAVPLYPLAIAAAAGMGLLGAAHAIGERTSEQRGGGGGFDFRYRNAYAYLFTGIGMLLTPLLAASLIKMTGFLGFLGVILQVLSWVVIWATTMVGLGAVILSRAGTQRTFARSPLDMNFESDPYGPEPGPAAPHA